MESSHLNTYTCFEFPREGNRVLKETMEEEKGAIGSPKKVCWHFLNKRELFQIFNSSVLSVKELLSQPVNKVLIRVIS